MSPAGDLPLARSDLRPCRGDEPRTVFRVQHLLRVSREQVAVDRCERRLVLALGQVEAVQRTLAAIDALVEDEAGLAGLQVVEVSSRNGQGNDAVLDAVEVDRERLLLLGVGLLLSGGRGRFLARLRGLLGALGRLVGGLLRRRLGLLRLLLVALLRERRHDSLAQHHQVDVPLAAHVRVRLREPVLQRAGVGRPEEVQVLAALVEDGLGHFAQAVGDGDRLVLFDRVGEHGVHESLRVHDVGQPLRIRRPVEGQRVDRAVDPVAADALHVPGGQVQPEDRLGVVRKRHLLAVGRPAQVLVEACASQLELLHVALAVVRGDVQFVLARRVREVGDAGAVRRPLRRSLVRRHAACDVARVALLGRHRHDFASELEDRPCAGRRDARVADVVGALHEPGPGLAQVRRHGNDEALRGSGGRVQQVQPAGLLVHDLAAARRRLEHREVVVLRDSADLLRRGVVRVDVELAVTVRAEVDRATNPHRIHVVRAVGRLRHLLDGIVRGVVEPETRDASAAILLPLVVRRRQRVVRDAAAVGRVGRLEGVRNGQLHFHPALDGHGEEVLVGAGERGAAGGEQHLLPVYREALNEVGAGVPGQPLRHAALGRHDEHVGVAVVLRRERDELPVRRKRRAALHAIVGRQAPDVGAVEFRDPQVVGVDERHVRAVGGGLGQQARVARVGLGRDGGGQDERREQDEQGESGQSHVYRPPSRITNAPQDTRGNARI